MSAKDFSLIASKKALGPFAYLDSASTTQKPDCVVERLVSYYQNETSNIHRGLYELAATSSNLYEESRARLASFLGCTPPEIIFNSGATEGLNALALGLEAEFKPGDVILVSELEHHSNFLPWQRLARRTGAELRLIPLLANGLLDQQAFDKELSTNKVKLVALALVSHVLGNILPVKEMFARARRHGVSFTVCDATQAVTREKINVVDLNCDALVFSGHKAFAPSGIGVLFASRELEERLAPAFVGGGMVEQVTMGEMWLREIPLRFEAGTPAIEAAIALGTAVDFIESLDLAEVDRRERELIELAASALRERGDCELYGWAETTGSFPPHAGILSFAVRGVHAHDVAQVLADGGVAVRAGFHCAQPLMTKLKLQGTVRVSLSVYNTRDDIDLFLKALSGIDSLRGAV